ncbi:Glycosyltransferase [Lunatimonas lonarensis]|uniref:Glycosyltransferase n=1 Tax=Lunatimonas lonarensis TaxID=1232681 RepID=R7ZP99_9BACT|nr:glycosyltransferase [Lunatimonas lonarensis]EON75888.1 Glycosyltransferase [Lunatimonas lonarensis]
MKIIVLSTVFYIPGKSKSYTTKVVNFFVKEWVNMGHEVLVFYNKSIFNKIYYKLPKYAYDLLESSLGIVVDNNDGIPNDVNYYEGAKVFTLPMVKIIPFSSYSDSLINKQLFKIRRILDQEVFIPDLILGHWPNPQLDLIPKLKELYSSRTSVVFHNSIKNLSKRQINKLKNFDHVGFRNTSLMKEAEKIVDKLNNTFICYSGIPDEFFTCAVLREGSFCEKVRKFVFVGTLIKRKHPTAVLQALITSKKRDFSLKIVGDGQQKKQLIKIIEQYNLEQNVSIIARMDRKDLISILLEAECLTMISKDEAFGLVYLEAMACGCLVVAAKGEGMDGIIEDRVNGFLCEAGNEDELASIYQYMDSLSPEEKTAISNRAIDTAKRFTDTKVAKYYLEAVCQR